MWFNISSGLAANRCGPARPAGDAGHAPGVAQGGGVRVAAAARGGEHPDRGAGVPDPLLPIDSIHATSEGSGRQDRRSGEVLQRRRRIAGEPGASRG